MADDDDGKTGYKLLAMIASLLGALVARRLLSTVWKLARGKEPPANPEHPTVTWPEAVSWAVLSGAVVGVARLIAQKKVADSFHRAGHRGGHDTRSRAAVTRG
jgi:hypothetical protein